VVVDLPFWEVIKEYPKKRCVSAIRIMKESGGLPRKGLKGGQGNQGTVKRF